MPKSILFVIPCGRFALSGVFRVMDYLPFLHRDGFSYKVINYQSPALYDWLYLKGGVHSFWNKKSYSIYLERTYSLIKMLYILLIAKRYDVIFIEKITPPKWWVRWLKKVNDRIIYDIDDAMFTKSPKRTQYLIKNSRRVVAGSHFIFDYCRSINPKTTLLPTPVPLHIYPKHVTPSTQNKTVINLGWVGTTGNLQYLTLLQEPFARLSQNFPDKVRLTIIGHIKQFETLKSLFTDIQIDLKPYIDPENIFDHIADFDIGLMPLFDGDWEKGKCASKALVYMAAHVPVVCSRVGENMEVIQDGVNGFLASDEDEWILKLSKLIENPNLRATLGAEGRKTVEQKYSTEVCYNILLNEVLLKLK